ncbi:MAG TPA: methylmalonyl Co-A mutase-associated GTPase MeaB, partial [Alphaproteobacteria bacterium]|nr:methylmalonyl Co-A mutase-associated GTPase MeaB [Alphaproteobacteria bacterium]
LAYAAGGAWRIPVLGLSALTGDGLDELEAAIACHRAHLGAEGRGATRRGEQARAWLADAVRERFGAEGLERAGAPSLAVGEAPFRALKRLVDALLA